MLKMAPDALMLVCVSTGNKSLVIPSIVPCMAKGGIICSTHGATVSCLSAKSTIALALEILSEEEVFFPVKWHCDPTAEDGNQL